MPLRIFLVHDDASVDRIAVRRFERLMTRGDLNERWPEYAGKRLRYALLGVEHGTEAGDQRRVVHASFGFVTLDAEGRQSRESAEKAMHDAVGLIGGVMMSETETSNVIGEQAFRQRRYKVEHSWEPSKEVVRRIQDALDAEARPVRRAKAPHLQPV